MRHPAFLSWVYKPYSRHENVPGAVFQGGPFLMATVSYSCRLERFGNVPIESCPQFYRSQKKRLRMPSTKCWRVPGLVLGREEVPDGFE